jgi:hypothetical protein
MVGRRSHGSLTGKLQDKTLRAERFFAAIHEFAREN